MSEWQKIIPRRISNEQMKQGYFGDFGGRYVPETLVYALDELERGFKEAWADKKFHKYLSYYWKKYGGRPTPLYFAKNLSQALNQKIYLKREDLCYTGAHKINNTVGQALLALKLKKKRIIAETGAGQHGVATAAAARLFNLKCEIYMGQEDIQRQEINVYRMKLLGADVISVKSGSKTLKDAINECLRDWVTNVKDTYYLLGSTVGPHPYPTIVKSFQSIIGKETKLQILKEEKRLPDYLLACVGGGSNALGLFSPFYENRNVKMIGVESDGATSLTKGSVGIFHGMKSFVLQTNDGQIKNTNSIAPGLDYPAVGPEHAFYKLTNRAQYYTVSDEEAVEAFHWLSNSEGISPALEPAFAIAFLKKGKFREGSIIVVCLSGRGDKDIEIVRKYKKK